MSISIICKLITGFRSQLVIICMGCFKVWFCKVERQEISTHDCIFSFLLRYQGGCLGHCLIFQHLYSILFTYSKSTVLYQQSTNAALAKLFLYTITITTLSKTLSTIALTLKECQIYLLCKINSVSSAGFCCPLPPN